MGPCENELIERKASPNGKLDAVGSTKVDELPGESVLLRPIETDAEYAEVSGTSLYVWLQYPETLLLEPLTFGSPSPAFLAHCILVLGAGEKESFKGCEIAIGVPFRGEPLDVIEEDLMRTVLTGLTDGVPDSLECLVSFSADEFSEARVLLALLCICNWESQLIVRHRPLVCNISHDDYFAFHSSSQEVLNDLKKELAAARFHVVRRCDI